MATVDPAASAATRPAATGPALRKVDERLIEQLTVACHVLYLEGQNDMNNGQVSARVPGREGFWIRGAALGFDEVTTDDFIWVSPEGERLWGHRAVPSEWPIHSEAYAARPDVNAIIHTHAPNATAFGTLDQELLALSHDACPFAGQLKTFRATTNTILDRPTARLMVADLDENPALLLKNHGLVAVGGNIKEATVRALLLDRACGFQLRFPPGTVPDPSPAQDIEKKNQFIFSNLSLSTYWSYYLRKLERVRLGVQLPERVLG